MFNIFPRDQVLVLPFDYFTMEQFDATNNILRFLNLTEIDNPKQILKVNFTFHKSLCSNFNQESILWSLVHSKGRSYYASRNQKITRRVLRSIQSTIGRADERWSIFVSAYSTKQYRTRWPIVTFKNGTPPIVLPELT